VHLACEEVLESLVSLPPLTLMHPVLEQVLEKVRAYNRRLLASIADTD
jgi:hypothetical protein